MFFTETVPSRLQQVEKIKMNTSEIIMFVIEDDKLFAILNSYGSSSEKGIGIPDNRSGIYRPTVCWDMAERTFIEYCENTKRELGRNVFPEMNIFISRMKPLYTISAKMSFGVIIPGRLAEKIRTPYYSGGIRLVAEEEVENIVTVYPGGRAPVNRNCLSMFEGGLKALKRGFEMFCTSLAR